MPTEVRCVLIHFYELGMYCIIAVTEVYMYARVVRSIDCNIQLQWSLLYPNSLGHRHVQIMD